MKDRTEKVGRLEKERRRGIERNSIKEVGRREKKLQERGRTRKRKRVNKGRKKIRGGEQKNGRKRWRREGAGGSAVAKSNQPLHEHEFTSGLREKSMRRFGERIRRREK